MVHLRKGELKAETACRAVAHLDCAAVRNDRILHDGKAETCTAGFAGAAGVDTVEAVEEMRYMSLTDTYTIVAELEVIELSVLTCKDKLTLSAF